MLLVDRAILREKVRLAGDGGRSLLMACSLGLGFLRY